jgi:carbonic anhydrase/acetyltransferase-like protein (isoleucine patch superfamily)/ribosomal protein S18 acetylase RimI-like enzyme
MGERVKDVFVAPTAVVTGDVTLSEGCSVWHGAVLRGDEDAIVLGPRTNVQDNAVIHVSARHPTVLGAGVTVGHGAIVHGCTVGDNTLIGMGSIVLDGASIGSNCIVGAGALVKKGDCIPDGCVVIGMPARIARKMTEDDIAANRHNADVYVRLARKTTGVRLPEPPTRENQMQIRRAQASDISDIQRLLVQVCTVHAEGRPDLFQAGGTKYTAAELEEIIADDDRPIFVGVGEDGHVMGYAFCVIEDFTQDTARTHVRSLYIDDICVDEAARGRHVGSAVYNYVIDWAREQGFYNVTLNVWSCNPGAQRFYEAMGMKPYKIGMEQVL